MGRGTKDQKLDELREVRVFARCSPAQLRRIGAAVDEVVVPAGRTLCEQGRYGTACHLLLDGSAEVVAGDLLVGTLGAGDSVGLVAALDLLPHVTTVRTTSPCRLYTITDRALRDLVVEVPELALALLNELGGHLRQRAVADAAVPVPA